LSALTWAESLWATAIHNFETNQDSYYGLKDLNGKRKEDRLYNLLHPSVDRRSSETVR
jgi:hypothetical protein